MFDIRATSRVMRSVEAGLNVNERCLSVRSNPYASQVPEEFRCYSLVASCRKVMFAGNDSRFDPMGGRSLYLDTFEVTLQR